MWGGAVRVGKIVRVITCLGTKPFEAARDSAVCGGFSVELDVNSNIA